MIKALRIAAARRAYNKACRAYNTYVRSRSYDTEIGYALFKARMKATDRLAQLIAK